MGRTVGDLQQLVMLAIARLGDDAYGGSVRNELARVGGREVSVSTVYVTMVRLEADGLVRSEQRDPDEAEDAGRRRRYFELTAAGQQALLDTRATHARMWTGLEIEG